MGVIRNILNAIGGDRPKAEFVRESVGYIGQSWTFSYDGEKNLGEIGPARNYLMNYPMLRVRSWQAYVESEVAQIVLNKWTTWVIGQGLKLRCEPAQLVLKQEGIGNFNSEQFNEIAEARWELFASSKRVDIAENVDLNRNAAIAHKSAIIGGDVLIVLRVKKGRIIIQQIDGQNVCTPLGMITENIVDGVEFDTVTGKVIAYHVKTGIVTFERIPAIEPKSGMKMAYMVYGSKLRIGSYRGMPLIGTVLETLKKLERYKEATVGSAEEVAKVAYQAVHSNASTGENPLAGQLARAFNFNDSIGSDIPVTDDGRYRNNVVAATNNKAFINNPVGAELKILENKNPLYFNDFYTVNIKLICAAIGIPEEVAMSAYNSNFSASHAARGDWSHALDVARGDFSMQYYQPIYDLWLHLQILTNKVNAPQYLTALAQDNWEIVEAYRKARFIGVAMPHIDPFKVVKAERAKLGSLADQIPLTTVEAATDVVSGGNSDSNLAQFAEELKEAKRVGVSNPVAASI
jgi:hypothetical protein